MKYLLVILVAFIICFGSTGCSATGVRVDRDNIVYLEADLADLADILLDKDRADDLAYYNDQKYLRVQGRVTGIFTLNSQRQFSIKPIDGEDTVFLISGAMNEGFDPLFDDEDTDDTETHKLAEDDIVTIEGEFIGRTYSLVAEEGKFIVHTIIFNDQVYSYID